jgi:hypothetical protein
MRNPVRRQRVDQRAAALVGLQHAAEDALRQSSIGEFDPLGRVTVEVGYDFAKRN